MNISLNQFQILTFVIFFFFVFFDTKIYIALWAAIFHLIQIAAKAFFANNAQIYKSVITIYVVIVLVSYLYKFRDVLFSDKKITYAKLEILSSDKKRQRRIGTAILLLIVINVTAVFIFRN